MKFCPQCGNAIMEDAIFCVHCGCAVNNIFPGQAQKPAVFDEVSIPLCIVAALFPIFGFIYWPMRYKITPKKAKACGITALISWALAVVLLLI